MKKLLVTLVFGAFAVAHSPSFAQDKGSEPTKEEVKKADAKKNAASETQKAVTRKKVKKGGC